MKFWVYQHMWRSTENLFSDMKTDCRVEYYGPLINNKYIRYLLFIYFRSKERFGKIPAVLYKLPAMHKEEITFIFIGGMNILFGLNGVIERIKKRFVNAKFVAYFSDINDINHFDVNNLKRVFDLVYVFDKHKASDMHIDFFPLPMTDSKKSDLLFIGQGKGRQKKLEDLASHLGLYDISCYFYVVDESTKHPRLVNGVWHGPMMEHSEVVSKMQNTNCILELKSDTSYAFTDRVQKAILYNKKVLTDNPDIVEHEFYKPELMAYFDSIPQIDLKFICEPVYKYSYNYNGEYSTSCWLSDIEGKLGKRSL